MQSSWRVGQGELDHSERLQILWSVRLLRDSLPCLGGNALDVADTRSDPGRDMREIAGPSMAFYSAAQEVQRHTPISLDAAARRVRGFAKPILQPTRVHILFVVHNDTVRKLAVK